MKDQIWEFFFRYLVFNFNKMQQHAHNKRNHRKIFLKNVKFFSSKF